MTSPRRAELLEAAYEWVLDHGPSALSLRPVAEAIGSSTGVLRFLFGTKDGLVTAVLDRARQDERALLAGTTAAGPGDLAETAAQLWLWLAAPQHRRQLRLWTECYALSLRATGEDDPFATFARATVADWLAVLRGAQPARTRDTADAAAARTAVLGVLRGCLLDLLATGDLPRTTRAVRHALGSVAGPSGGYV
ncbi:TetR/AcrR family transcriptional regulator [Jatrophihabitans fulvus]